ncbi:MAG: hypothetical protein RDU30_00220 [Desulfovibrionaceae bacterium]|nr:hypothetical protein [Desulfovibrionaceae bacterium]
MSGHHEVFGCPALLNRGPSPRRGSALLYVIASIVLLGAVGGGVAYFSSSSSVSNVAKTAHNQAYYAAVSGLRYAEAPGTDLAALENSTTTYSLGNNVAFRMTVGAKAASAYPVTVCGIYGAGTSMEANHQLPSVPVIPGSGEEPDEYGGYDISIPGDAYQIAGAKSAHAGMANKLNDVVTEGHPDYAGTEYIRLGNRTTQGFACLWFNDTKTILEDTTYCQNGVCKFGKGFRLYLELQVVSAGADGFTLSFVNAANNTVSDCGGDLDMGELLGYGGPGVSGRGLRPAKIAIEFDTYENGSGTCGSAGSRNDDDDGHIAYSYWGSIDGCKTYDDNLHGAGGTTNDGRSTIDGGEYSGNRTRNPLYNSVNMNNTKTKTGTNITYKKVTNLEDNTVHTVRMEVTRATNANGSGAYTMKTWLDCTVGGEPCEGIKKLTEDFAAKTPDLVTSFTMDKYFHGLLNTFLVGFTQATGASAQEVHLTNFRLKFRE